MEHYRAPMLKIVLRLLLFLIISIPSCGYNTKWQTEMVDGENSSVGQYTHLALDSNDNPHISYYDEENKVIKYAAKDSSGWNIETVDSTGSYGVLALDSNDIVHISYSDSSNKYLKYGYRDSTGWHMEIVDEGESLLKNSIAVDANDQPHIIYVNSIQNVSGYAQEQYYYKDELKYAYKDSAGWHIETVESTEWQSHILYPSLVLDSYNNPHMSFYFYTSLWPHSRPGVGSFLYAHKQSAEWIIESINADTVGGAGYNAIAVDSQNNIYISFYRGTYQDAQKLNLRYAYKNIAGWNIKTIDSAMDVGKYNSIALDSHNDPAISYYDGYNRDLKYAFENAFGWHLKTVDSIGEVGRFTSMVVDSNGNPRISYYDESNKDLKYAYLGN